MGWCLNLVLWLAMKGQAQWWLVPLGLQSGISAGGFLMVTLGMLSNTMAADVAETLVAAAKEWSLRLGVVAG